MTLRKIGNTLHRITCVGLGVGLGLFWGAVIVNVGIDKYENHKRVQMEKKMIKWSPDGKDFVGLVSYDERYKWLNGRTYKSPKGNLEVSINDSGLKLIENDFLGNKIDKQLHLDGNTLYCSIKSPIELFNATFYETVYEVKFDDEGNEIIIESSNNSHESNGSHQPSGHINGINLN
jgi:hypothetical protein